MPAPPASAGQLFLASHHEELTNRLIELLVPPAGRKLHLLRFIGWTPEQGPRTEQRQARQNPALDPAMRHRLSQMLAASWPSEANPRA